MKTNRPWTPGPWEQYVCKGYDIATIGKNLGEGRGLLQIAEVPNTSDEREANARLITAAPELYEQLNVAMRLLREVWSNNPNHPIWKDGYAALDKARGTSPE